VEKPAGQFLGSMKLESVAAVMLRVLGVSIIFGGINDAAVSLGNWQIALGITEMIVGVMAGIGIIRGSPTLASRFCLYSDDGIVDGERLKPD